MAHFSSVSKKSYISTSFKVMWSALKRQENLLKVKALPLFFYKILEILGFRTKYKHYILVRNPYNRLESFFKDKFRKNLPVSRGQTVHRLFYPIWGITKKTSLEEVHRIILAYSFEDFIKELPNVYNKDPHLYPQYRIEFIGFRFFNWRLKCDKVFKMEQKKDIDCLSDSLNLNLNKSINSTGDLKVEIIWNKELRGIVNKIYKNDFEWYNYQKL